MTRSVEARLHNLERSALLRSKMDISDEELLEALNRRWLNETQLRALYKRIEKPHAVVIMLSAWVIRSYWLDKNEQGQKLIRTITRGFTASVAAHLAWPAGTVPRALVGDYRDHLTWKSSPLPLTENRRTFWETDLRCWLAQHFVSTRGRKTLQAQIANDVEAGRLADGLIPILGDDERDSLLDLVDSMESMYPDAPVLVWGDLNDRLCTSHKPPPGDKSGQKWTYWGRTLT